MKQTDDRTLQIKATLRQACAEAGLNFDSLQPGVVPLFEIISAYPLRVAALPEGKRLTARSAVEFLGRETGKELALPVPNDSDRPLSGFIYVFEYEGFYSGCIFTEWRDPITRRRFSAAHELAHYLLHFLPLLEQRRREGTSEPLTLTEGVDVKDEMREVPEAQISASEGVDILQPLALHKAWQEQELEANLFAAELLMPAHACEELVRQYAQRFNMKSEVRARLLARDFFVSAEAMTWRLKELDLYM